MLLYYGSFIQNHAMNETKQLVQKSFILQEYHTFLFILRTITLCISVNVINITLHRKTMTFSGRGRIS